MFVTVAMVALAVNGCTQQELITMGEFLFSEKM